MSRATVIAMAGACAAACAHHEPIPAPLPTPPPLPAETVPLLGTMEAECEGLVAALTSYQTCPNLEDRDVATLQAWVERANRDFAGSRQVNPDASSRGAIAEACHRAKVSVTAAHERCAAGPRPKVDE